MIGLGVGLILLAILLVYIATAGWQSHVAATHVTATQSGNSSKP